MKAATSGMISHIAGDVTTLATCWRIERRDGVVYGFTDHDRDLVISGTTYYAPTGYSRAALASRSDLSVDETEVLGLVNPDMFTERDIRAGIWDYAEVRIFLVNYANLGLGEIKLRRGRLGEVIINDDGTFRVELRGLTQQLQQTVGELYSPECRADLGDSRCKVPVAPSLRANSTAYAAGAYMRVAAHAAVIFEATTAGTSAGSAPTFDTTVGNTTTDGSVVWTARAVWTKAAEVASSSAKDSAVLVNDGIGSNPDAYFTGGVATFTSGNNIGVSRDVLGWVASTRTLSMFLPFPFDIEAGDTLTIQPGCDKRLETCKTFNNKNNFRGEPHVPGANAMIATPLRT